MYKMLMLLLVVFTSILTACESSEPSVLTVRGLRVVDESGRVIAVLGTSTEGGPLLALYGEHGNVELYSGPNQNSLLIHSDSVANQVFLFADSTESAVQTNFRGRKNMMASLPNETVFAGGQDSGEFFTARASLFVNDLGSGLAVFDANRNAVAGLAWNTSYGSAVLSPSYLTATAPTVPSNSQVFWGSVTEGLTRAVGDRILGNR